MALEECKMKLLMLFYGHVNQPAKLRCWSRMMLRRPMLLLSEIASLGFEWVRNVKIK